MVAGLIVVVVCVGWLDCSVSLLDLLGLLVMDEIKLDNPLNIAGLMSHFQQLQRTLLELLQLQRLRCPCDVAGW